MTWQKYKKNLRNSLLLENFFSIMEQFDTLLVQTIDSTLGLRCTLFGYQYSEILRSLITRLRSQFVTLKIKIEIWQII